MAHAGGPRLRFSLFLQDGASGAGILRPDAYLTEIAELLV